MFIIYQEIILKMLTYQSQNSNEQFMSKLNYLTWQFSKVHCIGGYGYFSDINPSTLIICKNGPSIIK